MSIPTKTKDNCSYTSMIPNDVGQLESKSKFDAFQYYSSDLLRLKTLLLSPEEDGDEPGTLAAINDILKSAGLSIKQNEVGTRPQRKTRLSWEVHPSLLLHDLYEEGQEIQSV